MSNVSCWYFAHVLTSNPVHLGLLGYTMMDFWSTLRRNQRGSFFSKLVWSSTYSAVWIYWEESLISIWNFYITHKQPLVQQTENCLLCPALCTSSRVGQVPCLSAHPLTSQGQRSAVGANCLKKEVSVSEQMFTVQGPWLTPGIWDLAHTRGTTLQATHSRAVRHAWCTPVTGEEAVA